MTARVLIECRAVRSPAGSYMTSSQMGIRHDAATPRPTKPVSAAGYKVGYRGHVPGAKFDLGCSPYSEQ